MKDPVLPPYEESYPVFSFLLDPGRRLSIPAAFGMVGDAAGRDATRRGWGYEELQRQNRAWVLIRARMQIDRSPGWGEHLTLRTWPKSMEGMLAYRDFLFIDGQGKVLIAGTTAWTMMDIETRRPVRLNGFDYHTGELAEMHAITDKPSKIAWPRDLRMVNRIRAEYGHLDMNNHVNNSRYIEWFLNQIPAQTLFGRRVKELEVNFLSEVKLHDQLEILTHDGPGHPDEFSGFIRISEDNRQAFAARCIFDQ